jgi:hypothetical protein
MRLADGEELLSYVSGFSRRLSAASSPKLIHPVETPQSRVSATLDLRGQKSN